MYRHLPGTGSFALGFFSGFLGCILIVLRGGVPNSVAVVVEHSLIFSAFVLFYRGILLFFRSPRTTRFLSIMCVVALLLLTYFSAAEDRVAARIVIVSFVLLVSRGLIAVELLVRVVEEAFDGGFLDGSVHAFDLTIGPGMVRLGEAVFDSVDMAGPIEGMAAEAGGWPLAILRKVGELDAIVGEHGVDTSEPTAIWSRTPRSARSSSLSKSHEALSNIKGQH